MGLGRSSTTSSLTRQPSPDLLKRLKRCLGYASGSEKTGEVPYIEYILAQWPGKGTLDDFVRLFVATVEYFTEDEIGRHTNGLTRTCTHSELRSIQKYLTTLLQDSTQPYFKDLSISYSYDVRLKVITDTVLLILGTWVLMHSYFVPQRGDARHVLAAYSCVTRKDPLNTTLTELVLKSNLLPNPAEVAAAISGKECISPCSQFSLHPAVGSVESLDIPTLSLNASKLANLGAVRILWTHNLSRHMILSNHAKMYYLELFALPSALQGGPDAVLHSAGISSDLMDEICQSYANLFNPIKTPVWHRRLLKYVAGDFWCWCLYCSSQRLRRSQLKYLKSMHRAPKMSRHLNTTRIVFDISLQELMDHRATGWDQTEFRNLWPRIQALDAHLAASKPWNFWVIFRDRRDSVQFWTFFFGTMVLLLTFIQVLLGIAQIGVGFSRQ